MEHAMVALPLVDLVDLAAAAIARRHSSRNASSSAVIVNTVNRMPSISLAIRTAYSSSMSWIDSAEIVTRRFASPSTSPSALQHSQRLA